VWVRWVAVRSSTPLARASPSSRRRGVGDLAFSRGQGDAVLEDGRAADVERDGVEIQGVAEQHVGQAALRPSSVSGAVLLGEAGRVVAVWQVGVQEHQLSDLRYSAVRDYVVRRRPEILAAAGREIEEAFVPQTPEPGAEGEVDFADLWVDLAGVRTKCFLFTLRLSFSGKAVHRAYSTQGHEARPHRAPLPVGPRDLRMT